MATYPIKMLKDEENKPFVPLVSTDCIRDENNQTLQQILDKKLSPTNLLSGEYVSITTEGNNCYVNVDLPASLNVINNLTTASAGQGALDAYQGKILKDSIPQVVNDLSSTSTISALSANQGYVLNNKFNNYLPLSGGTISGNIIVDGSILKNEQEVLIPSISNIWGYLSQTTAGPNDRYWVHLCHIKMKSLPQGMMWKITVAMGMGNNGTTNQNCYADIFFQTGWSGSNGGRPGVNYEFHPLSTGIATFKVIVTTDDAYNYDLWCYKVSGYSRFNYWYNIDSRYIEITDTSNEYSTDTPVGLSTNCNIQGGIVSYEPFTTE